MNAQPLRRDRATAIHLDFRDDSGCADDRSAILFTTNPGLESIVADEFEALLARAGLDAAEFELKPLGLGGHVLARVPGNDERLWNVALQSRAVHHVLNPLYSFDVGAGSLEGAPIGVDALAEIHRQLRDRGVAQLESAPSFRVTTRRIGEHSFSSIDVQRAAGAALVERHGCAVDLHSFDCNVRVDLFGSCCMVGVQLTRHPLSRRHPRVYRPRTALKANVAYALLHMARLRADDGPLLDPFCGSGTILLEAAELFPTLDLLGSDFADEAVAGTAANAAAAGIESRLSVQHCDAREIAGQFRPGAIQAIVTNPPYGVRLGRNIDFVGFYRRFLESAAAVLKPGGRLVLIAWKRGAIDRANRALRLFKRTHVRVVETGGIYPRIYVLERFR